MGIASLLGSRLVKKSYCEGGKCKRKMYKLNVKKISKLGKMSPILLMFQPTNSIQFNRIFYFYKNYSEFVMKLS